MTHGNMGRAFDLAGFLQGAVRVVVVLALAVVVVLVIWPAPLAGQRGQEADLAALLGQRQALVQAVQAKREVRLEASEPAVNAYLAATLKAAQGHEEPVAAWMMRLDDLNVALMSGVVTLTTLAHWGPLAITWEVSGTPKLVDGHFDLEVKTGRIGHLGLPQAGADWMATRLAAVLNRWRADRELLDQLAGVVAEHGAVTLVTGPAKP